MNGALLSPPRTSPSIRRPFQNHTIPPYIRASAHRRGLTASAVHAVQTVGRAGEAAHLVCEQPIASCYAATYMPWVQSSTAMPAQQ